MIVFNEPLIIGTEQENLNQVIRGGYFCGNGEFTKICETLLANQFQAKKVLLTSSGSSALSIAAELLDIQPGDEIILPSFTHVGTASAFALRKANLIWCEIKTLTRNLDEEALESLITRKTKAVIAVNYAGMTDNIDKIKEICTHHSLILIEDNASGIGADYQNQPLGSFGDLAIISFHQTKNIHCGEGGALIINTPKFLQPAQKIRDRGTDRKDFNEGRINTWTWHLNGSNYYLSEFQAAFLFAQIIKLGEVNFYRQSLLKGYLQNLKGILPERSLPLIDENCYSNGHCFSILTESEQHRQYIIDKLHQKGIQSAFHYQPLHKAPYWQGLYKNLKLPATEKVAETILRLPMHHNLCLNDINEICQALADAFTSGRNHECK
ncbi:MAG: dTDP-4-amino-4,6-dideoxygalactose transaminase [Candidatus Cloacimonetes bacterium]|nr:dTDP-4-amino-4,6-dideoxygalactose transaminase [Candidatus Cloacimonadota bacterium]